ncbi:MAG: phage minor head protein [Psychroserpens sp.]|uniref:phage head morphogenesis protein n=1 Tax=Psychroserpens sp. TaxID=2020870 RepID=UPI003C8F9221
MPWAEFKKLALEVSGLYNLNWLETEYRHTIATANMAAKWEDFKRNVDLYPNLRYEAVNDKRTRDKHRELDGLVAPLNHPIWKKIYPPLDFGCRCNATQTDDDVSKDLTDPKIKDGFENNAAISGKVFGEIPYEKSLGDSAIAEANANFKKFRGAA